MENLGLGYSTVAGETLRPNTFNYWFFRGFLLFFVFFLMTPSQSQANQGSTAIQPGAPLEPSPSPSYESSTRPESLVDQGPRTVTVGNFFLSLGLGSTLGLGLGHAIQGRYGEEGGFFTISELGSLIVIGAGLLECSSPGDYLFFKSPDFTPSEQAGCRLIKAGSLTFVGIRIFEVLDLLQGLPVWIRDSTQVSLVPGLNRISVRVWF